MLEHDPTMSVCCCSRQAAQAQTSLCAMRLLQQPGAVLQVSSQQLQLPTMAEAGGGVSIERALVVRWGGGEGKTPWLIANAEHVDGIDFVVLHKRETGFCRFVSGSTTGCNRMLYLDELKKLRTAESFRVASEMGQDEKTDNLFDMENPSKKAKKVQKQMAQSQAQLGVLPAWVTLNMPDIDTPKGMVKGINMRVKTCLDVHQAVSVEVSCANFAYIRAAMHASPEAARKQTATDKGYRWHSSKKVFLASRKEEDRTVFKSFRPRDSSDQAFAAAEAAAGDWAAHRDCEADGSDEAAASPGDASTGGA